MIPQIGQQRRGDQPLQKRRQPSLTWKLDLTRGKVTGKTDELDAVRQAVYKILQTERFAYAIYSFQYGHELKQLLGSNPLFARSEVKRLLTEALLQDDRIVAVEQVETELEGDRMTVRFTVVTQLGSFQEEVTEFV